ncbi:MAG: hypothetical protein V7752_17785 [Halopseudomonas sp.]
MSSCCNTAKQTSRRPCPGSGQDCAEVEGRTVLHHLNEPWHYPHSDEQHFFCDVPSCNIVYFTEHDTALEQSQLRTQVGQKRTDPQRTLCYCYGVHAAQAEANPAVKQFVTEQTKAKACACDTRNPSGRCCLKNFPKISKP